MYVLATETLEDGTIKITYGDQYGNVVGYGYYSPVVVEEAGAQTSDFPVLTSVYEEWESHTYLIGNDAPTSGQGVVGQYFLRTNNVNPGLWSWYGPKAESGTIWPLVGTVGSTTVVGNGYPALNCTAVGKDLYWWPGGSLIFDNYTPEGKNSRTLVRYDQATDTWIQSKGEFASADRGGSWKAYTGTIDMDSPSLPYTLNAEAGTFWDLTLTGNNYIRLGPPAISYDEQACSIYVIVRQDGTGGWSNTWITTGVTIEWPGGVEPALPQGANDWIMYNFVTFDNGLNWHASIMGSSEEGFPLTLDQISNVNAPSPSSGDFLKWNGSAWVNDAIDLGTDTTGNYVADVSAGTGVSVSHTPGEGSTATVSLNAALDDLSNVTVPSPSNGEALVWNGSAWVNSTVTASVAALDDVGNVTAPTPTSGDFLKWNGSAWVNDAIDLGTDTTGNYMTDVSAGTGISVTHTPAEGSTATVSLNAALDNLSDVVVTTPNEFDTLEYNGTSWINKHASVATRVKNAEATTLQTGEVVYIFSASGDMATVKRADNDSDTTSSKTLGIVASPITAGSEGTVVTRGYVDGIDLSTGYTPGDILWLAEDGGFTKTKPTPPEHLVFVGVVCRANANGIVYVAVQNGYELEELHDVVINPSTLASGDFLKWNGTSWVNDPINLGTDTVGNYVSDVTAGTNISVSHTPGEGSSPTVNLNITSTTSADTAGPRLITHSTSDPTGGANGDVWLKYTP